jgi:hypothetical protein
MEDIVQNTSFTASYNAGNRLTACQIPLASASTHQQTWNYDDEGNWNSTTKNGNLKTRNHSASEAPLQIGFTYEEAKDKEKAIRTYRTNTTST